jgi:sortase A
MSIGRTRHRILRATERLLLIAGVLALGSYAGMQVRSRVFESYSRWAFDQELRGQPPSIAGYFHHLMHPTERPAPSAAVPEPRPLEEIAPSKENWSKKRSEAYDESLARDPGRPMARLDIPVLDLSVIVLEGTDTWTLDRAVGHIRGTALPGINGNIGIAGHRDGFFRGLKDVTEGSEVFLTTPAASYRYRVRGVEIVAPDENSVLDDSARPMLTLVTCYPFYYVGDAPKRFVVKAQLEEGPTPPLPHSLMMASYRPSQATTQAMTQAAAPAAPARSVVLEPAKPEPAKRRIARPAAPNRRPHQVQVAAVKPPPPEPAAPAVEAPPKPVPVVSASSPPPPKPAAPAAEVPHRPTQSVRTSSPPPPSRFIGHRIGSKVVNVFRNGIRRARQVD